MISERDFYTPFSLKILDEKDQEPTERVMKDREMYLKGRNGYPEPPPKGLSKRDRECYMMGYSTSETLQDF